MDGMGYKVFWYNLVVTGQPHMTLSQGAEHQPPYETFAFSFQTAFCAQKKQHVFLLGCSSKLVSKLRISGLQPQYIPFRSRWNKPFTNHWFTKFVGHPSIHRRIQRWKRFFPFKLGDVKFPCYFSGYLNLIHTCIEVVFVQILEFKYLLLLAPMWFCFFMLYQYDFSSSSFSSFKIHLWIIWLKDGQNGKVTLQEKFET